MCWCCCRDSLTRPFGRIEAWSKLVSRRRTCGSLALKFKRAHNNNNNKKCEMFLLFLLRLSTLSPLCAHCFFSWSRMVYFCFVFVFFFFFRLFFFFFFCLGFVRFTSREKKRASRQRDLVFTTADKLMMICWSFSCFFFLFSCRLKVEKWLCLGISHFHAPETSNQDRESRLLLFFLSYILPPSPVLTV